MKENKKKFDCVEFKRKAQERIYEDIKTLTWEQEVEYFRKGAETGPLADWWKRVKAAQEQKRKKAG